MFLQTITPETHYELMEDIRMCTSKKELIIQAQEIECQRQAKEKVYN